MPNYFANGSPWASDAAGFANVGNALSEAMLQMPRQKQQQQMQMLQMMMERQRLQNEQANVQSQIKLRESQLGQGPAHAKLYDAQAEKGKADAMRLLAEISAAKTMGRGANLLDASKQPMTTGGSQFTPMPAPTTGPTIANLGPLGRADLLQGAAESAALKGQPERFANFQQQNAVNEANDPIMKILAPLIATGTKTLNNVPQGSTQVDAVTGQPSFRANTNIPEGGTYMSQFGEVLGKGQERKDKSTATLHGLSPQIVSSIFNAYAKGLQPGVDMPPELDQAFKTVAKYVNQPDGGEGGTKTVTSKADFDALPSGAVYTNAKDGKQYTKP